MKILAWLLAAANLLVGARNLLEALGVLGSGKYAPATHAVFAALFLGLGACGLWFAAAKHAPKLAALLGVAPWVLALVVMAIVLVTSRPQ